MDSLAVVVKAQASVSQTRKTSTLAFLMWIFALALRLPLFVNDTLKNLNLSKRLSDIPPMWGEHCFSYPMRHAFA